MIDGRYRQLHRFQKLGAFIRQEVASRLKSTAQRAVIQLGLAVPDVDGPALRVKPGSPAVYSAGPCPRQHEVGDLDDLLGAEWDVISHPKNKAHCRYVANVRCRMSASGAIDMIVLLVDGKFPFPAPSGQNHRDLANEEISASVSAWEI